MCCSEELLAGLVYVIDYKLTLKELEILVKLIEKNMTTLQLAKFFNCDISRIHPLLRRLCLKGIIRANGKDSQGYHLYEFKNN